MGALGVALGTMVANLSSHKRGWDDKWKEYSEWALMGKEIQNKLLDLVDEDTEAFNMILKAYALPKKSEEEISKRNQAVQDATKNAILVPYKVMETALPAFALLREMVEKGNPTSVSDAGVGALALRASVKGAFLNVRINAMGLDDKTFAADIIARGCTIETKAMMEEEAIIKLVESMIVKGQ
jgi:glutamate formiminotransferase/formiminotetrahydrofolate cyclodeaminase